jgi:hypothetical protein
MREIRNAYKILVGKPEVNRLLETARRRRKDNIKIYLQLGDEELASGD